MSAAAPETVCNAATPLDVFECPLDGIRLIEASAGTGKTWNLCGLYLRLVLERALQVQQILVVTFTNAATAELRERIRERMVQVLQVLHQRGPAADVFAQKLLASLRRKGLADEDMIRRLAAAAQNFDEAAIFTIHGFCQRALADAPFAAGMPLAQELLLDDADLRLAIASDFWRRHVAAPGVAPALAAHLMAQGDSPERFAQLLRRQAGKPLSRVIWPPALDAAPPHIDTSGVQAAHEAARGLWHAQRDQIVGCVMAALPRLHAGSYKAERVRDAALLWDQLLAPAGALAAPPGFGKEQSKVDLLTAATLAAKLKKAQAPCEAHPFFAAAQALLEQRERLQAGLQLARLALLRRLIEEGPAALRESKRERRVVAFDDMLFNLHQRLADGRWRWLPDALRERFPAALVDEFQDTDPLQFSIFRSIYGGGQSLLFLVGDPKQAIYSFRNADLHTYLQARRLARAEYTLAHNQRSTRELLAALNAVFGGNPHAFMLPGLRYTPVEAGDKRRAVLRDASAPRAPLQLWTLPPQAGGERPRKAFARQLATLACAGEIARLLAAARDGEIALDERPLAAGDIAVLVRSHSQGHEMRQALLALGVGSVELSQASVFHSADALELERVLAAVAEPAREGLLRTALATELIGLDAVAIAALSEDQRGMLARIQAFSDHRQRWLKDGVARMLRDLLAQEQVSQRMLARPDGERRLTNLRHLAECLHEASREHGTPEALLRWLRQRREENGAEEAGQLRLESDRNLVQIVTIHRSKGLEYPIVFCPFLWDGHPGGAPGGPPGAEYHDDDGGPVIDFVEPLDPGVKQRIAMERAAENLRLIYVALTRAVHRCYLVVGSYGSGAHGSTTECTRGPINWLVARREHTPAEWLDNSIAAAEVDAAWERLAQANAPNVAIAPLPPGPGVPVALSMTAPERIAALEPPAAIPAAWWVGSYSSLAHGARSETAAADHDVRAEGGLSLPPPPEEGWGEGVFLPPPAREGWTGGMPLTPTLSPGGRGSENLAPGGRGSENPAPAGKGGTEGLPLPPAGEGRGEGDSAPSDILRFPRGARAGESLHAVFERIDFTAPQAWPTAVAQALRLRPPQAGTADGAAWQAMVLRMLSDVTATPLPAGHRLDQIPPNRRLIELEFSLPSVGLDAHALAATLRRYGYPVSGLAFGRLDGYLRGFVDLAYQHQERWYVLDWKSNHLGWRAADYDAANLRRAMEEQGYHLQYLLYTVALHRYLQQRLRGYDYERHFGGVHYLFVRGVRPAWTQPGTAAAGVFFDRPEREAIEALDALLGRREEVLA